MNICTLFTSCTENYDNSVYAEIVNQILTTKFNNLIHFETLTINSLLCKIHIYFDLQHIYVDLQYCDIVNKILTN